MLLTILSCYIGLFIISIILVGRFRSFAIQRNLIDHPNYRSSHTIPTPRGGGIIFVILWSLFTLTAAILHFVPHNYALVFLPGALLVSCIGYLDDHINLSAKWRMTFYLTAAIWGIHILGGFEELNTGIGIIHLGWIGTILGIIAITWSINLFNFMDGSDGLASLEAIFIFSIGGLLLWLADGVYLAILAWALAITIAGFLFWNWPRAKIFMGDTGSVFLGFLVAEFAFAGEKWFQVPAFLWLILYSVFCFDATVTVIRRMLAGEKWYQAHRKHAFQRLHQAGWSHRKVLGAFSVVNIFLSICVLIAFHYPDTIVLVVAVTLICFTALYSAIEKIQPMFIEH